jgi:tetratricopeptide (TPR) repeat protein
VQAIVDITHALALGPPTAAWYKLRAAIEATQGYINPRIEDLKRAVALTPKDIDLYLELAEAYVADEDLGKAVATADQAVGLAPDNADVLAQRSNLRLLRNNIDGAKADAQAAIAKAADYPAGYAALARVYMAAPDYAAALAQIEEAIKRTDNRAILVILRGRIQVHLNQLDKADIDFQAAAAAVGEENPDLLLGQAELAIARKDADSALAALRRWESTDPHYGWGYVMQAAIEADAKQPVKALADLEQARKRALYPEERARAEELAGKLR